MQTFFVSALDYRFALCKHPSIAALCRSTWEATIALYDPTPRETVEVPSLDFTVQDLLDWARRKPADEAYDYYDSINCACGQFARSRGLGFGSGHRGTVELRLSRYARPEPWTFGGLVKRLEGLDK